MPLNWIDTTQLSFNNLLLLERSQLSWLPGWLPEPELALALQANPVVEWYMRQKCPEIKSWLDQVCTLKPQAAGRDAIEAAEQCVLQSMQDLIVYAVDPGIYDAQPFLNWDSKELTGVVDFRDKIVLDIGAGTGRLALIAATTAQVVFAVEPVGNLRYYLKAKSRRLGYENVYPVDGLITEIPFPDHFAHITLSGHTFGDHPTAERRELERVTCPGGMVILCPGNSDRDDLPHQELVENGYEWSRFEEPRDGWKRKYWKVMSS